MSTQLEVRSTHTIPTSEELAVMIVGREAYLGIHKESKVAHDVHFVEDGVAFRPIDSKDHIEWEWMRPSDFDRAFNTLSYSDPSRIEALAGCIVTAVSNMSKKSFRRFQKEMIKKKKVEDTTLPIF